MVTIRRLTIEQAIAEIEAYPVSRKIDFIGVHNTASHSKDYRGISTVQGIQRFHIQTRNFVDIGYNFLVGPTGMVYTGRPINRAGAHIKGYNHNSVGVAAIANFSLESPTAWGGRENFLKLIRALMKKLKLTSKQVRFHREFANTSCPGNNMDLNIFRNWIDEAVEQQVTQGRPVKVVFHPGPTPNIDGYVIDGSTWVAIRDVIGLVNEALNVDIEVIMGGDGKVYLIDRG